jgi:serine-type D-Ala-D-Ala carboxypeptidase (penicillin-binding protein 5/6)
LPYRYSSNSQRRPGSRPGGRWLLGRLLVILGISVALIAGLDLTGGSGGDRILESALNAPPSGAQLPPSTPTPDAPTVCPACNQDEDHWRRLTSQPPPVLLGESAALIEGSCGRLLYGAGSDRRHAPASLAKIATALVVVERAKLDELVDIKINAWDLVVESGSSVMGLEAGMRLSVEELLYGLLLASGNDAALALSDHLGGEARLVRMMNDTVRALGLRDTVLRNSHGLDEDGAYSTPLDMAILGRTLLANPVLSRIVATESRPNGWNGLTMWNGNYLMYVYEDAIGIKTGYTEAAGWSIVAAARRDDRVLIASIMNSGDPYWDAMRLFDWAYKEIKPDC